jgi:hypothetical protein
MTAAAGPSRRAIGRLLDFIEVAGNKVPHPVMMFLYLIIGVVLLSQVLYVLGVSVTDEILVPVPQPVVPEYYPDTTYPGANAGDTLDYDVGDQGGHDPDREPALHRGHPLHLHVVRGRTSPGSAWSRSRSSP